MEENRTKVNNYYSGWSSITSGVPEGSILGPLIFIIFINFIFYFVDDVHLASYADDNTPHTTAKDIDTVKIDNILDFNDHVSMIYKKASHKLHALARISPFMNKNKLGVLMKAFIESQFGYCPLIWMFHSRKLNNKINRLHQRALRLVYKNSTLSFNEHQRNLQQLAT